MCGALCKSVEIPIAPLTNINPQPSIQPAAIEYVSEDVSKGANWFYWIAALSIINSIIMMTGAHWAFIMGLGITQVFDGVADVITEETGAKGVHIIVLVVDLICAGFFVMLGYFAGRAKRWAFIVGLVIYSLDGIIYLLSGSFLGVAIHGLAIFSIFKGMMAINNPSRT